MSRAGEGGASVAQQRGFGSPDSAFSGTQQDLEGFHVVCRICERSVRAATFQACQGAIPATIIRA